MLYKDSVSLTPLIRPPKAQHLVHVPEGGNRTKQGMAGFYSGEVRCGCMSQKRYASREAKPGHSDTFLANRGNWNCYRPSMPAVDLFLLQKTKKKKKKKKNRRKRRILTELAKEAMVWHQTDWQPSGSYGDRLRHSARLRTSPYLTDWRSSMAGNAEEEETDWLTDVDGHESRYRTLPVRGNMEVNSKPFSNKLIQLKGKTPQWRASADIFTHSTSHTRISSFCSFPSSPARTMGVTCWWDFCICDHFF